MTKKDFEKAVSAFDDTEAFLCAAHVDGKLMTASNGEPMTVVLGAIQVIVDAIRCTDNKLQHLFVISSILHSEMLMELHSKKEETQ